MGSKKDNNSLDTRMKIYELPYKQRIVNKMPIIIRLDGKAFHTFTKGLKKPFDDLLIDTMQKTTVSLCKDIQGAKFGYTQSDEITIISTLDDFIRSQQYLDGKVQKILSITASKATKYFNMHFYNNVEKLKENPNLFKEIVDYEVYSKKIFKAEFDCRVMNIPETDIINNIIWRQEDASKNSLSALAQSHFTQKELDKKKKSDLMDMLMLEKGINWNDLPIYKKRGSCCYRNENRKWVLDLNMPIITKDRNFIEKHYIKENN